MLSTALSTPSLAGGRGGLSVSLGGATGAVGGAVGGVGGAVGGVGGTVGGISSGNLGGAGISVGCGGFGSSGGFTGSNFFSGGANFGNNASGRVSNGTREVGQHKTREINRGSALAAKGLKHKSSKIVEGTGQTGLKAQAAAKKAAPVLAKSRTINVGGDRGATANYTPDSTMAGSVRVGPAAIRPRRPRPPPATARPRRLPRPTPRRSTRPAQKSATATRVAAWRRPMSAR